MKHVMHGTTVIAVIRDGKACIGSDGQVSLDTTILKSTARKVRRLYNDSVLVGFAGATADAFTLVDRSKSNSKPNAATWSEVPSSLPKRGAPIVTYGDLRHCSLHQRERKLYSSVETVMSLSRRITSQRLDRAATSHVQQPVHSFVIQRLMPVGLWKNRSASLQRYASTRMISLRSKS